MRPWLAAAAAVLLLLFWCGLPRAQEDKDIYLWKDRRGKTHLTEEPPQEGGSIQEQITPTPGPPPDAAQRRPAVEAAEERRREDSLERCRLADTTRKFALKARQAANALNARAGEARRDAKDLKERAGFDEDRLDDFKYEIRRREEKARWLEDLARQAVLQADAADLLTRLAQSVAGDRCP